MMDAHKLGIPVACVDIQQCQPEKLAAEEADRLWMEQTFAAVTKSRKSKKRSQKVPKPVLDFGNVSKASKQPVDKGETSKSLKNAQEQPSIAVDKISRVEGGGDNKSTQKRANELKTNVLARNQLSIGTKEGSYKTG